MKKIIICITVLLFSGFIYAKGAFVEVGDPSFFPDDFTSLISMKIDNDGNIYAAYIQGYYYFSVAKFDGESWSDVGERKFSGKMGDTGSQHDVTADAGSNISFTLDKSGMPYVSFSEAQNYSLNVMKFNSESGKWEYVGKSNITDYKTNYTSIAVDSEGVPYVVFNGCTTDDCKRTDEDYGEYTIDAPIIMKYENGSWEYVGEQMLLFENVPTEDSSYGDKILFDSNDIPYIAFSDGGEDVFVMKFNGTEWEMVGDTDSLDIKNFGAFLIDSKNEIYLNCLEVYGLANPGVLKLDGDKWNRLADVEKGRSYFTIDQEDQVIKTTDLESTGLSVKKLNDEGLWEVIGDKEYIHESVHSALVETDPNNIPYVAFAENGGVVLMKYDPEAGETPDDADDDIVSDEETVSDEDSAPVNDKDSGSSGCTMVVF